MPYLDELIKGRELQDSDIVPNPLMESPLKDAMSRYQMQVKEAVNAKNWNLLKRDILLIWADSREADRVHDKFEYTRHVVSDFEVDLSKKVYMGIDTSGQNPAVVFGQCVGSIVYIFDELHTQAPFFVFVDDFLIPLIESKYGGVRNVEALVDPSDARGSNDGLKPSIILSRRGIRAVPAYGGNKMKTRVDGVNGMFINNQLMIDKKCPWLIEGLEKGYVYKKMKYQKEHSGRVDDKNEYSHICDALQYLVSKYVNFKSLNDGGGKKFNVKLKDRVW
jgi:hypothetical protein